MIVIETVLSKFSNLIGSEEIAPIAYHQLTPLSVMDGQNCGISFAAKCGGAHDQNSTNYSALATVFYKANFPNLHAVTCHLTPDDDILEAINSSSHVSLLGELNPDHNMLLIPTFSPLNCVGIFTFNINRTHTQSAGQARLSALVSTLLVQSQACHLKICMVQAETDSETVKLTDRERQILQWIARGKSNGVVAEILGISLHTVTGYLRNIYLKTQTNDRTSAAIFAMQRGLLYTPNTPGGEADLDIAI